MPRPCPPKLRRALRDVAFLDATHGAVARDASEVVQRRQRREERRVVAFHLDGALQTIGRVPSYGEYEGDGVRGDRASITEFTKRARNHMIRTVASICQEAHVLLGTLTYPLQFSTFPAIWKDDLDKFGKRFLRKYPAGSIVWKLEAQHRGAPHFHLLVFGLDWMDKEWLAKSWEDAVGSGCDDHGDAGTKIEEPREECAAVRYACKSYVTKASDMPDFWQECGRLWGVIGRKNLPRSRVMECEVSTEVAFRYRRIVSRWHRSCGRKKLGHGTQSVFGIKHAQWIRALQFCESGTIPAMHLGPSTGETLLTIFPR